MSAESKNTLRFVFITPCVHEDFFNPVKKGMRDAADMMGVSCEFIGTEDVDLKAQVHMVAQAVLEGYDGIAVSLIDPIAFDQVVQEAIDRGVPVVAFNVDDHDTPNARLSAVCQNLYMAGRSLGQAVVDDISIGGRVLMTVHSEGISALQDRLRGIQDIFREKNITWKVVVTGTTPAQAADVITRALKADAQIKAILCTGQADTEGAGLAVERESAVGKWIIAGFDLSPEILRLIKVGIIKFTIDQQPYVQGFYPVIQLTLYCRYAIRPSNMDVGAAMITSQNVDQVMKLSQQGYR